MPGDVIEIKDKIVYRNGEKLELIMYALKKGYHLAIADNVEKVHWFLVFIDDAITGITVQTAAFGDM